MQVYDSAASLAKYLETADFRERCLTGTMDTTTCLKGKSVVELGAGTGVTGIMAAHYGAKTVITDMPCLMNLIDYNIEKNKHLITGDITALSYTWGEDTVSPLLYNPDLLIIANCVYYEGSLEVLADSVRELAHERTIVLACYEERSKDIEKLISKWHSIIGEWFTIDDVPKNIIPQTYYQDYVRIVVMRLK